MFFIRWSQYNSGMNCTEKIMPVTQDKRTPPVDRSPPLATCSVEGEMGVSGSGAFSANNNGIVGPLNIDPEEDRRKRGRRTVGRRPPSQVREFLARLNWSS